MLYNKKLTIQYLGINFAGWQVQKNARTVQDEIQKALSKMYKQKITIAGSGRTDSGVHALGQTASFRSSIYLENKAVLLGLNSLLPEDVSVSSVEDVPEDFHAQKSAVKKTYLYRIYNGNIRSALDWGRVWWVKQPLDSEKMGNLLKVFEGEHDFTSFCVQASLRENNVRKILDTQYYKEGRHLCFEITGNGFLHNMVRIIMGTIVQACRDDEDGEYIKKVIAAKDRNKAGPTAGAEGLYLKNVSYIS